MKVFSFALVVLAGYTLLGCGPKTSEESLVTITGSSTIAPLLGEIAKQYESTKGGVRVDVQAGGSSKGLMDVRSRISDIGMVSRKIKPSEADIAYSTIAIDGLAIIVNRSNPIDSITSEQVQAIYKGHIQNWSEVGGLSAPLTVVNKAEGRSTLEVFTKHFKLQNREIDADVVIGDNQQGIQTVAGNPNAIGYVSIGAAEYEVAANDIAIKLLTLDGVSASTENVRNGSYGINRELNLVYKHDLAPEAREFIDYVNSADATPLFHAHSLIQAGPRSGLALGSP
jgi:phosphate transport system substrate-binding protein